MVTNLKVIVNDRQNLVTYSIVKLSVVFKESSVFREEETRQAILKVVVNWLNKRSQERKGGTDCAEGGEMFMKCKRKGDTVPRLAVPSLAYTDKARLSLPPYTVHTFYLPGSSCISTLWDEPSSKYCKPRGSVRLTAKD
ncbi:hypothetical protein J6590_023208 [Homalodisca vitripennis]|nr:hypothetical protein J6590_023208 [Homalodisca vitripennis]